MLKKYSVYFCDFLKLVIYWIWNHFWAYKNPTNTTIVLTKAETCDEQLQEDIALSVKAWEPLAKALVQQKSFWETDDLLF